MGYTPHVLVIGGGVLGTGVARDLAIRGLDVTLVEQGTLTAGASGRNLGVLYSGARTTGSEQLAKRQSRESQLLRQTAEHCIDNTGGLLVTDGETEGSRFDEIQDALQSRSLPHEAIDGEDAREAEPSLSSAVERALSVPDAVVDAFSLTVGNAKSAVEHGATVRTRTAVTDIAVDGNTLDTVTVEHRPIAAEGTGADGDTKADGGQSNDGRPGGTREREDSRGRGAHTPGGLDTSPSLPGEVAAQFKTAESVSTEVIDPDYVVNATGAWASELTELAGIDIELRYSAGTTGVLHESVVGTVVTRCGSMNDETIAPQGRQAVIGPAREDVSDPHEAAVRSLEAVRERMSNVVPGVEGKRLLRKHCGVQSSHPEAESEHDHTLIDHGDRDDCWGITTVVGGSLTTHRFVAEQVADDICAKFGIQRECKTDKIPLPGSAEPKSPQATAEQLGVETPTTAFERGVTRLGDRAPDVLGHSGPNPVLCECQSVTRAEVTDALADETATETDLEDVRIRTSATTGECQGGRCAHRIAAELFPEYDEQTVGDALDAFLNGHWEGQRHALCGAQFRRIMRTYIHQTETMNQVRTGVTLVPSKREDVEKALENDESPVSRDTVGLTTFDDGERHERRERPMWGERPL